MIQTQALISKELSLVLAKVLPTARNVWYHLHYELCPSVCIKDDNKMSRGHSVVWAEVVPVLRLKLQLKHSQVFPQAAILFNF
jgi:hypothetical protein